MEIMQYYKPKKIIHYYRPNRGIEKFFTSYVDFKDFWKKQNISGLTPVEHDKVALSLDTKLEEIVDEPLINLINHLNNLNIDTLSSRVCKETEQGEFAFIKINGKTLSKDNKGWLETLKGNFPQKVSLYKGKDGELSSAILKMPVNENTTYGDIEDGFMRMIEPLKIQDVPLVDRGIAFSVIQHQVASAWKCKPEDIDESCNKVTIAQFVKHDGIWYRSEDTYQRHINYLNSLEKHQDTQTQQEIESK